MKAVALDTLSLNLLKTFCVFAETGRVEETAQRLQITQASVSLQLKKLEEESGQVLFKTVGRKKLLSKFARDLFQSIAPPFKELEQKLKEVSKTQVTLEKRLLRIACRQDFIKRLTPLIHFPGQIELIAMPSSAALKALKNDEVDMAVVANPVVSNDWMTRVIFSDHPTLIANPKILKAKHWDDITHELLQFPAISYNKSNPNVSEVADYLGALPGTLKVKMYCEDWHSIISAVKESNTWSVLPREFKNETAGLVVFQVPKRILKTNEICSVQSKEWRGIEVFN